MCGLVQLCINQSYDFTCAVFSAPPGGVLGVISISSFFNKGYAKCLSLGTLNSFSIFWGLAQFCIKASITMIISCYIPYSNSREFFL